jgi:hypothetical protein
LRNMNPMTATAVGVGTERSMRLGRALSRQIQFALRVLWQARPTLAFLGQLVLAEELSVQ